MKIAIKYCGGCNPRIRRKKIVNKVQEKCEKFNFEIYDPEKNYDFIIGINGCHVACGIDEDLKENSKIMIVGGLTLNGHRLKSKEELIEKIMDELNYKLKEGKKMNWKNDYKNKLSSANEAVKAIKSGNRVVIAHACAEPQDLIGAMVARKDELEDVEVVHMVAMGSADYTKKEMAGHFHHNALFVGVSTRKAIKENRANYTPSFFFEIPELFKNEQLKVDVALIQLSKPDKHGYCSYGVSVDYTKAAAEKADIVIAEVNENMPRTHGCNIHVSELDYIVESDHEIIELPNPEIGEIEKNIGENVAQLIEDGSTLQLGIGAIPDAVLSFLKDKKNLGIHSEMISDGVVDLVKEGVINNSQKTLNPGKIIVTFLMGTKKLYSFVDDNPIVQVLPADYTNNPIIIGQNDKLVSINSAVEVDFMGQVAAETINGNQISGVGGQVDYVRGASFSKGGKAIIALPSTAGGGKYSRIVSKLEKGTPVTTSRNDVHYIVTEYGVANLKGKTLKDRAKELIKIAHPDFREELKKEFTKIYNY